MGGIFVSIYRFFSLRKWLLWLTMVISIVVMAIGALFVRFDEDIYNFFPKQEGDISQVFNSLKVKDKLVVMFSCDGSDQGIDAAICAAEAFEAQINDSSQFTDNAELTVAVESDMIDGITSMIYENLPLFIDDEIYNRLDSLTSDEAIEKRMMSNYQNLISPIGGYISDHIFNDPLGLAGETFKGLEDLGKNFNYTIIDDYIFSTDNKTLIGYISPKEGRNDDELVDIIEASIETISVENPDVNIEYFGAPAVAVYNARQIKWDSIVTLNIALLIIVLLITFAFRNRYSVLLIISPVIYGALFALSLISVINGSISLIAVGSGSIIFGIALSYSIHIIAHTNHTSDVEQMIRELAYPLTVGSFTTVGAFVGLLFTSSKLLQDFGLFSSLTLIGTTIFALVFLPHFVTIGTTTERGENRVLKFVNLISNIHFDKSRFVVVAIVLVTAICALFSSRVGFDSNMMNLNYEPTHLADAEQRLNSLYNYNSEESNILFIASSTKSKDATEQYRELCSMLDTLQSKGEISSYASISRFVVSKEEQEQRLKRWREFWSEERKSNVTEKIEREAERLGFERGAFCNFTNIIDSSYQPIDYNIDNKISELFPDWISTSDGVTSFIAQVRLLNDKKEGIYSEISNHDGLIAVDRAFFASLMAEDVQQNFYLILYISGILIFVALLLSYGRFELAAMAFLPMGVSWTIILGVMGIMGIEFNIVTIILSTFIFGIGDDFSIFMMDGLLGEYRDRSKVLVQHKGAILFSAFTVVVGMGALIFAKHPAMYSLGLISLIGIAVVVLVTYTVMPMIFRLFISSQGRNGGLPLTILSLLHSIYTFGLFAIGCIMIQIITLLLHLIPLNRRYRKELIHRLVSCSSRSFLKVILTIKVVKVDELRESFLKPAVIVANHQSFTDILLLLSLNHKMVMVTNGWVWHSPLFGRIVRYLDFYHTQDGYENLVESLREKVADGYSVIVFPEGTRSADFKIGRFHKGAFYLAEKLRLDILPIVLYGTGLASSKRQPMYIKHSLLITKILPRISPDNRPYKERAKEIAKYFKAEYNKVYEEYNRVSNPYFKDAIIKNYIYKGPVLEWYMRVKLRLEGWYDYYDRIVPREGVIVDLGCGYGAMSYMLSMLSDKRRVIAMDYDEQKIEVAKNCALKSERIEFFHGDIRTFEAPSADAFIISDVLHYIDYDAQQEVISRCAERLNDGGVILVRDGDSESAESHERTKQSEKWSTKIMKFNKVDGALHFLSRNRLEQMANRAGLQLRVVKSGVKTSNTLFVLTKGNI